MPTSDLEAFVLTGGTEVRLWLPEFFEPTAAQQVVLKRQMFQTGVKHNEDGNRTFNLPLVPHTRTKLGRDGKEYPADATEFKVYVRTLPNRTVLMWAVVNRRGDYEPVAAVKEYRVGTLYARRQQAVRDASDLVDMVADTLFGNAFGPPEEGEGWGEPVPTFGELEDAFGAPVDEPTADDEADLHEDLVLDD